MQHQTPDWLLAGSITFITGTAVTLLLGQPPTRAVIAGTATAGSGVGLAALQTSRTKDLRRQLEERKYALQQGQTIEQLNQKVDWLRNQGSELKEQIRADELQLNQCRGKFAELERRCELLTTDYERVQQQVEEERRSLLSLIKNHEIKQAEVNQLNSQISQLEKQKQELVTQSTRLELERSIYDGLLGEREKLENRTQQLKNEKTNLESELKRILESIQSNAVKYEQVEAIRQQIEVLDRQRRDFKREADLLKARINQNTDELTALESKIRQRKEELKGVEGDSEKLVDFALQALKDPLWKLEQLPKNQHQFENEAAFITGFEAYIRAHGFSFPSRVIRAFHTSLKVQGISALVVLAGISGTGKSELPQLYAKYIGAQFISLPVQPRWDSPQDLTGFYNYVENKFKPTTLLRGLYQYPKLGGDRIVIVLLDEMNLARVEYYFSDFLSKLESRRNHPENARLEIDLGSLPVREEIRKLPIPQQFLFVGTMNEDETTQTLSDKVLDRANVLTFGKPGTLKLSNDSPASSSHSGYLTYHQLQDWFMVADPASEIARTLTEILDRTNAAMEAMGHPFAHRVYQAITTYVVNYPGVQNPQSEAFRSALADQFAQKLLPKLRGVMVHEEHNQDALKQLEDIIQGEIRDPALQKAFEKAKDDQYGQFHWKGLIYPES